jgi:hypothetical protein
VDLTADEGEPDPEFEQGPLQLGDPGLLEVAFGDLTREPEEVETYGSLASAAASSESSALKVAAKFEGAAPWRWRAWPWIWLSSTFRDQPPATACSAYQSRSSSLSISSRTRPHGICATACGTTGHAAAKHRM